MHGRGGGVALAAVAAVAAVAAAGGAAGQDYGVNRLPDGAGSCYGVTSDNTGLSGWSTSSGNFACRTEGGNFWPRNFEAWGGAAHIASTQGSAITYTYYGSNLQYQISGVARRRSASSTCTVSVVAAKNGGGLNPGQVDVAETVGTVGAWATFSYKGSSTGNADRVVVQLSSSGAGCAFDEVRLRLADGAAGTCRSEWECGTFTTGDGSTLNCGTCGNDEACPTNGGECHCPDLSGADCLGTPNYCRLLSNACGKSVQCGDLCGTLQTGYVCNETSSVLPGECICPDATAADCVRGSTCDIQLSACGGASFDCANAPGFNDRLDCNNAVTDRTCNPTTNQCDCDTVPTSMCDYGMTCGSYTNNCGNSLNCGSLPAYSNNQDCNNAVTDRSCSGNTCVCDPVPSSECVRGSTCGVFENACMNSFDCANAPGFTSSTDCNNAVTDRTCNPTTNDCECDAGTADLCIRGSTCNRPENACQNSFDCANAPGFNDRLDCDNDNTDRTCNPTTNECDCDPVPNSVCVFGETCGRFTNQCSRSRNCGTNCGPDKTCNGNACICNQHTCPGPRAPNENPCGTHYNSCGNAAPGSCGGCSGPSYCTNITFNGYCTCDIQSCADQSKQCGVHSDGCFGTVDCDVEIGGCPPPGQPLLTACSQGRCIDPNCYPFTSCSNESWACTAPGEFLWNGCTNVSCGSCPGQQLCDTTTHQCQCNPQGSCQTAERECGDYYNGCDTVSCGTCPTGFECRANLTRTSCVALPQAPSPPPGEAGDDEGASGAAQGVPWWIFALAGAGGCILFGGLIGFLIWKKNSGGGSGGGAKKPVAGSSTSEESMDENPGVTVYGSVGAAAGGGGDDDVVVYGKVTDMDNSSDDGADSGGSGEVNYADLGQFREGGGDAGAEDDDGPVVYAALDQFRED